MSNSWDKNSDFLSDDDDQKTIETIETDKTPWVLLIVDDEQGIHDITKVALQRFSFDGRDLEILSAFNSQEALEILVARDDVALILLDVVMETDHAGLDFAHKVREQLENENVRIVLRTGQPGMAPEEDVILAYDINDYRAKTELTSQKLFSTVISALRNYRDLNTLQTYQDNAYNLLGENNNSIQFLIDKTDQPLLQVSTHLGIQRCNQAFADLLGKSSQELVGLTLSEIPQITYQQKNNEVLLSINKTNLCLTGVPKDDLVMTCYTGTTV